MIVMICTYTTDLVRKTMFKGHRDSLVWVLGGKGSSSPSQTPRGRENKQNQTSLNRTNVRKTLGLVLSSSSEVIPMLKGLQNTTTKLEQVASHIPAPAPSHISPYTSKFRMRSSSPHPSGYYLWDMRWRWHGDMRWRAGTTGEVFRYFFFYISALNIDCGYSLELPYQGGSTEYHQSTFLSRKKNK